MMKTEEEIRKELARLKRRAAKGDAVDDSYNQTHGKIEEIEWVLDDKDGK